MNKLNGTTLIEMAIVLIILSIIAIFSIPSFNYLIQKYRYKTIINYLVNDLRFAKTYANQHKIRVSMCKSSTGKTCEELNHYNWVTGWILFEDRNGRFMPNSENIIRYTQIFSPPHELIIESNINIANGINFNVYRRYGKTLGSGLPNGHYKLCAKNQQPYRVIINVFGITRVITEDSKC